ncbi:MAG: siderophore ABC transporter substrate-binding protein [Culicoidibacterales bacterium]
MKKLFGIITMSFVLVLAACTGGVTNTHTEDTASLVYTHEKGETVVKQNPKKVVVFDWATMDTMMSLNMDDTIIGTPHANMPGYLSQFTSDNYTNIGSAKEADFEVIAALEPELIIISGRQADLYDQLSEIAPTLYLSLDYTDYLQSVKTNVMILAEIFDVQTQAKELLAAIDTNITELQEQTAAIEGTTLMTLANDGKVSAYGNESRFGLVFETFGLKNADESIESSTHGQSISFEYILATNPDYLYVIDRSAVVGGTSSAQELFANDIIAQTKAAQSGNIIYLNADYWYAASGGIQALQEMITEIANSL